MRSNRFLIRLMFSVVLALPSLGLENAEAQVVYVDAGASGNNDGSSWCDAFASLQDALESAGPGRQVWVAAGVYRPDQGASQTLGDRTASFHLADGVAILGGFKGDEDSLQGREGLFAQTILSGDLAGDDGSSFMNYGENSYHVVTGVNVDSSASLDGFTIVGGNANGPHVEVAGGGAYLESASPNISNCTFSKNRADVNGGGVHVGDGSSVTMSDCTIERNESDNTGGGVTVILSSHLEMRRCSLVSNEASFVGGGMSSEAGSTVTLIQCEVVGNEGPSSGGGISSSRGVFSALNTTFRGNHATGTGGALTHTDSSSVAILVNCAFSGNTTSGAGGALSNGAAPGATTDVFQCVFTGNRAAQGGAIFNGTSHPLNVANSIFWENSDQNGSGESAQIANFGSVTLNFSCVMGLTGSFGGSGNIGSDPLLSTADGDYRLLAGSPCIDAGDNGAVPADSHDLDLDGDTSEPIPIDAEGLPRFLDDRETMDTGDLCAPIVDMGAFEFSDSVLVQLLVSDNSIDLSESEGLIVEARVRNGLVAANVDAYLWISLPDGSVSRINRLQNRSTPADLEVTRTVFSEVAGVGLLTALGPYVMGMRLVDSETGRSLSNASVTLSIVP